MDALVDPVFLGFRIKQPWDPGADWAPIERICSVGDDLCEPPEGWVDRWDFNRASCYPTPEAAWSIVDGDRAAYRLFAYFLLPVRLSGNEPPTVVPLDEIFKAGLPDLPGPPAAMADMAELGYDVAEHNFGDLGYAFSPLVTNGFSNDFPTNRYGLIDELSDIVRACEAINDQMPEHAPHWVFKVFAKDIGETFPT